MDEISNLTNKILESNEPSEIDNTRNQINDLVFSYQKGSAFKKLCIWNAVIDEHMENVRQRLKIIGNTTDINEIIYLVRSLESDKNQK